MNKNLLSYFPLLCWIVVFEAVSAFIGMSTQSSVDGWYAALARPSFTPPNIAFPVMWTILYAMIAAAGYYTWQARAVGAQARTRRGVFIAYIALNWSWSFVFFVQHQLLLGFIWIIGINILALALIVLSWRDVRRAAYLMIPPLLWTSFAAVLNGAFWWLNR